MGYVSESFKVTLYSLAMLFNWTSLIFLAGYHSFWPIIISDSTSNGNEGYKLFIQGIFVVALFLFIRSYLRAGRSVQAKIAEKAKWDKLSGYGINPQPFTVRIEPKDVGDKAGVGAKEFAELKEKVGELEERQGG